jgi:hypothetical protein
MLAMTMPRIVNVTEEWRPRLQHGDYVRVRDSYGVVDKVSTNGLVSVLTFSGPPVGDVPLDDIVAVTAWMDYND